MENIVDKTYAEMMDAQDPLINYRERFILPADQIYMCGNSLGMQTKTSLVAIKSELEKRSSQGVEGFFSGSRHRLEYDYEISNLLAPLIGGGYDEVIAMNSLTINLHLLLANFYQPHGKKNKILIEPMIFPSDRYALDSHASYRGYQDVLLTVNTHQKHGLLSTQDICHTIEQNHHHLCMIFLGAVNYYTGQSLDIATITQCAKKHNIIIGFDCAHAIGNVSLNLHNHDVDFAVRCSYKYLNSGPGAVGGCFVHRKHHTCIPRLQGRRGVQKDCRFEMKEDFMPDYGIQRRKNSTSPIIPLAIHRNALQLFNEIGGMSPIAQKANILTGYFLLLLQHLKQSYGDHIFEIITPIDPQHRGAQVSLYIPKNGKVLFQYLKSHHIIGDRREPNLIRLTPTPLYTRYIDIYQTYIALNQYYQDCVQNHL